MAPRLWEPLSARVRLRLPPFLRRRSPTLAATWPRWRRQRQRQPRRRRPPRRATTEVAAAAASPTICSRGLRTQDCLLSHRPYRRRWDTPLHGIRTVDVRNQPRNIKINTISIIPQASAVSPYSGLQSRGGGGGGGCLVPVSPLGGAEP